MSFRDRLERITGDTRGARPDTEVRPGIGELRKRIEEIMSRRGGAAHAQRPEVLRPRTTLEEAVGGEEVENSQGRFFSVQSVFGPSARHGHALIGELAELDGELAALLAAENSICGCSSGDALFIDTETTGLAGGTGTFPFLVGLGWFEGGAFVVRQLFARDFSEERAMLVHLEELATSRRFLISFNGKAFDMNLIGSRFILNRLEDRVTCMPHLDLLFPSRRLLGHRLVDARLATIERDVLGVRRTDDVPGNEIPSRYLAWLKRRDGACVSDVFAHNRLDVVSMASLLKHLSGLLASAHTQLRLCEGDVLAAGRLLRDRGLTREAMTLFTRAADSADRCVRREARVSLSLIHKRSGRWAEAARIWEALLDEDPLDVFAACELAKYLEHRVRDHRRAMGVISRVIHAGGEMKPHVRRDLEHRLKRLQEKAHAASQDDDREPDMLQGHSGP